MADMPADASTSLPVTPPAPSISPLPGGITYHIDIWTTPPSYVCVFCIPTARYTLEEVTRHLREVHDADAIPTADMDRLLQLRLDSDARMAALEAATPQPGAYVSPEPPAPAPQGTPTTPAPGQAPPGSPADAMPTQEEPPHA